MGTGHTKEIAEKLLPFQGRRVSPVIETLGIYVDCDA